MTSKSDAEKRLIALGLSDLPVTEVPAAPRPLPRDWFVQFRAARKKLLSVLLRQSQEEISMMNLDISEIMAMFRGEKIPLNISVKFKIPPVYGGPISPDNMFVCRTLPEGRAIDIFLAEQAGLPVLFYPNPAKRVYVTSMSSMNSPGGNATSDRVSEVLASDVISAIGGSRE